MLKQIDNNLWIAEQPFKYFGLSVGTRMTLIKLDNGELVAISPIDIKYINTSQINELGKVSHIIAPNCYHYLFAAKFKEVYPEATFWAAPGLPLKKPELHIDREISKDGIPFIKGIEYIFINNFATVSFKGSDTLNECVFFHPETRTLILTDLAFNFDDTFPTITQLTARVIGSYQSLSPSLLESLATRDKGKVREAIARIMTWDFDRVIMAHGSIIESGGKQKLAAGFAKF